MSAFDLTIVTPERTLFQGPVRALSLPAWEGSLGVLPGHAPALILMKEGLARIGRDGAADEILAVSGGFAEIGPKSVTLFAETAEMAVEVDGERARLAARRAKDKLQAALKHPKALDDADVENAQASLRRALVRLKVSEVGRRRRSLSPLPSSND